MPLKGQGNHTAYENNLKPKNKYRQLKEHTGDHIEKLQTKLGSRELQVKKNPLIEKVPSSPVNRNRRRLKTRF